jgi:hypothetical protein
MEKTIKAYEILVEKNMSEMVWKMVNKGKGVCVYFPQPHQLLISIKGKECV